MVYWLLAMSHINNLNAVDSHVAVVTDLIEKDFITTPKAEVCLEHAQEFDDNLQQPESFRSRRSRGRICSCQGKLSPDDSLLVAVRDIDGHSAQPSF